MCNRETETPGPASSLNPSDHPLAVEQREGISLDRLFEIYGLNGHKFE